MRLMNVSFVEVAGALRLRGLHTVAPLRFGSLG
jgi:hypothetical protein